MASYLEAAVAVDRNGDEVRRAMLDDFVGELGRANLVAAAGWVGGSDRVGRGLVEGRGGTT